MSKRWTHEEFIKKLYLINPNIKVIGRYNYIKEHIEVKCLNCNGLWNPVADSLLHNNGCPYCGKSPKNILIGFNDMWTTNPELAKLLLNPEDGYKYTQHSNKKVNWKCPSCGNEMKNISINDVNRRGLKCKYCSDGISYPEKFFANFLLQLKISFEIQKHFDWVKDKRYDFYLPDYNYVIETHGMQHYSESFVRISKNAKTLKEEKENDKFKKELAINNNISNYIIIDCRKSELEWIKNSILTSELSKLFDIKKINWLRCHEYACNSLVKIVCEYWMDGIKDINQIKCILGLSRDTIRKYLKQGYILNWCDYDSKKERIHNLHNMTVKSIKSVSKKVLCVETGIIYNSITEARKSVIKGSQHISNCCNGKRNTCGELEDGTKLHWKYVDDVEGGEI